MRINFNLDMVAVFQKYTDIVEVYELYPPEVRCYHSSVLDRASKHCLAVQNRQTKHEHQKKEKIQDKLAHSLHFGYRVKLLCMVLA